MGFITKHACDGKTGGETDRQNYYSKYHTSIAVSGGKNARKVFHRKLNVVYNTAAATALL